MDWMIYGMKLLITIAWFTLLVTIPITINPVSFISDFPPEIQEVYYRSQKVEKKKEALKKAMIVKKFDTFVLDWIFFARVKRWKRYFDSCPIGSCLCCDYRGGYAVDFSIMKVVLRDCTDFAHAGMERK